MVRDEPWLPRSKALCGAWEVVGWLGGGGGRARWFDGLRPTLERVETLVEPSLLAGQTNTVIRPRPSSAPVSVCVGDSFSRAADGKSTSMIYKTDRPGASSPFRTYVYYLEPPPTFVIFLTCDRPGFSTEIVFAVGSLRRVGYVGVSFHLCTVARNCNSKTESIEEGRRSIETWGEVGRERRDLRGTQREQQMSSEELDLVSNF